MIYEPLKGGDDKSTDAINICLHNFIFVMTALLFDSCSTYSHEKRPLFVNNIIRQSLFIYLMILGRCI